VFDTILDLPVHVLVVHAVVVLGPAAGLTAVAYAVRPPWRRALRVPLAVGAVLAALAAAVAAQSGEALQERLVRLGVGGSTLEAISLHAERGELARNVALAASVIALIATLWLLRPEPGGAEPPVAPPGGRATRLLVAVLLAVGGLAVVVTTTLAGHSGSRAVWSEIGAA
jgi:hypothetical protein